MDALENAQQITTGFPHTIPSIPYGRSHHHAYAGVVPGVVMIYVIASIHVKQGRFSEYLRILKASVRAVRGEKGCVEYVPTGDIDTGLPRQVLDDHVVTILEKWESLEALNAHLVSPHMLDYREKVKDLVDRVSIKVLREFQS